MSELRTSLDDTSLDEQAKADCLRLLQEQNKLIQKGSLHWLWHNLPKLGLPWLWHKLPKFGFPTAIAKVAKWHHHGQNKGEEERVVHPTARGNAAGHDQDQDQDRGTEGLGATRTLKRYNASTGRTLREAYLAGIVDGEKGFADEGTLALHYELFTQRQICRFPVT